MSVRECVCVCVCVRPSDLVQAVTFFSNRIFLNKYKTKPSEFAKQKFKIYKKYSNKFIMMSKKKIKYCCGAGVGRQPTALNGAASRVGPTDRPEFRSPPG